MCRSKAVDLVQGTNAGRDFQRPSQAPLVLQLAGLTLKYETLLALRVQREHLESNGVFALPGEAPKARKAIAQGLAQQFPGALRELDCWSAAGLALRLEDLAAERARAYGVPPTGAPKRMWVRAVLAYHAFMRQALAARNAARARRLADAPLTPRGERFLAWHAASQNGRDVCADVVASSRFAAESGRPVVALVCEDVANTLDCRPEAVRAWVFGDALI